MPRACPRAYDHRPCSLTSSACVEPRHTTRPRSRAPAHGSAGTPLTGWSADTDTRTCAQPQTSPPFPNSLCAHEEHKAPPQQCVTVPSPYTAQHPSGSSTHAPRHSTGCPCTNGSCISPTKPELSIPWSALSTAGNHHCWSAAAAHAVVPQSTALTEHAVCAVPHTQDVIVLPSCHMLPTCGPGA